MGAYDLIRETHNHGEQVLLSAELTCVGFSVPLISRFCSLGTEEHELRVGCARILESQPSGSSDYYMLQWALWSFQEEDEIFYQECLLKILFAFQQPSPEAL